MKQYSIPEVIQQIEGRFVEKYRYAANFVYTPVYHICLAVISDAEALQKIISYNNNGIPPVQTLLGIMDERSLHWYTLTDADAQQVGMLMAFLFKDVFRYKGQKEDIPIINSFGVLAATVYYDGESIEITTAVQ